ncbi:MAG: asparaginase [Propioniciclava sp.]
MRLHEAPAVAEVVRGSFVESVHHGVAAVTAADGAVARAVGDAEVVILARSAFKPLQAVAALSAGAPLDGSALALACASHAGEAFHLAGVRGMLAAAGLDEAALQNTPALPDDARARAAWLRDGLGPAAIAQNCSGKHAGMLTACRASGWSCADYLDVEHPLQKKIRSVVADFTGVPVVATEVDGCGAPTHGFALAGLARAFGRLACATDGPARRVADAMRAHPAHVGGTGRPDTELMAAVPGLIAKIGAEAVMAVGSPDGRGFAVKIVDGGDRAARVVMAALLREHGVDAAACAALADVPVLGHGAAVGSVRAIVPEA